MSMTHGYLMPGMPDFLDNQYVDPAGVRGNLDEQDVEEQIREEAYTDAWETSLSTAQDMIHNSHMLNEIQGIVEAVAMEIIKGKHHVE